MNDYEFTLRFVLPSRRGHDRIVDALYGHGCDDALIGSGRPGRLGLDFTRAAGSARAAVLSAISDVRKAVPGATLVEVTPDLVGVADLALMFSCSRQNMWKLIMADCSTAPAPAHEGKQSLWHLGPLLRWLAREKRYTVDPRLLDPRPRRWPSTWRWTPPRGPGHRARVAQAVRVAPCSPCATRGTRWRGATAPAHHASLRNLT